jgi:hypothetical protein
MTEEQKRALQAVVSYLESERDDYEDNPEADHIYLSVKVLQDFLEKGECIDGKWMTADGYFSDVEAAS